MKYRLDRSLQNDYRGELSKPPPRIDWVKRTGSLSTSWPRRQEPFQDKSESLKDLRGVG